MVDDAGTGGGTPEAMAPSRNPNRRKWVLGEPAHVLPTETGDYVLLTRARTPAPGSPQLPPMQPIEILQPKLQHPCPGRVDALFALSGCTRPGSAARLRPLEADERLQRSSLETDGFALHAGAVQLAVRGPSEAPRNVLSGGKKTPNPSVLRLRHARAREADQLQAAIAASKQDRSQEEAAAMEAALQASLIEADRHGQMKPAGKHTVSRISASDLAADITASRNAAEQSEVEHLPGASGDDDLKAAIEASRLSAQRETSQRNSSVDAAAEERELAAAIAASLHEQTLAEADRRYHQQVAMAACLDSLRPVRAAEASSSASDASNSGWSGVLQVSAPLPAAPDTRDTAGAAALGRLMARRVLDTSVAA